MTTTRGREATIEHPVGANGQVHVRIASGEVHVTAVTGETARVRDLDGDDLAERFDIERAAGRLVVRARDRVAVGAGWGRRGRAGVRIAVEAPATAAVAVETANGDIEVTGLRGEQRLRTASGAIVGRDVAGDVGVDAVSGDVRLEASGELALAGRLVSGDLSLRGGRLTSVALVTTSGDLALDAPLAGGGPFSVQTVSGDARVLAAGGLRVEARTLTGQVVSDSGDRASGGIGRRELVVGDGARTLSFRSVSGDLRILTSRSVPGGDGETPPRPPEPPVAPEPPDAPDPDADDRRMAVLRALEAGSIDVETATRRLASLDEEPTDG